MFEGGLRYEHGTEASSLSFPNALIGNPDQGSVLDTRLQHAGMTEYFSHCGRAGARPSIAGGSRSVGTVQANEFRLLKWVREHVPPSSLSFPNVRLDSMNRDESVTFGDEISPQFLGRNLVPFRGTGFNWESRSRLGPGYPLTTCGYDRVLQCHCGRAGARPSIFALIVNGEWPTDNCQLVIDRSQSFVEN